MLTFRSMSSKRGARVSSTWAARDSGESCVFGLIVPESQPVADNCAAMVSMMVEGVMVRLPVAWRGADATAHTGAALPEMDAN